GEPAAVLAHAEGAALLEDRGPALAVDRAVDPAPAEQRGVRGVHDRVGVLLSDIPPHQDDPGFGHGSPRHLPAAGPGEGSRRTTAGTAPCSRSARRGRPASPAAGCESAPPPGTAPSCRCRSAATAASPRSPS